MATVDILLPGMQFNTDWGLPAFCTVLLVRSDGKNIVVDTAHVGRRVRLEERLADFDLKPADIDTVVMTHAHWDHAQNFDLFPNAPMLLHPKERKYAQKPHVNDWATPQWTGAAMETHKIEEVVEGDEIAKGVTVIEMPGHSPGSIGLLVDTEDGIAGPTGDALHFASIALTGKNPLVFWNETEANDSIKKMVAAADILYPGHDRPFRLVNGEIEYTASFQLNITGVTAETEGVTFETPERAVWIMPGIEQQSLD
jgi:glyoxylase-like metal-dependent hydrolase (beta-lactamase superfamily II)